MNSVAYYDLALAAQVGRTAATVLARLTFWQTRSKFEHEGEVWVWRTYEEIAQEIGMSVMTVRRAVGRLVQEGFLKKARHWASRWKQTNFYHVTHLPRTVKTEEEAPKRTGQPSQVEQAEVEHSEQTEPTTMNTSLNKKEIKKPAKKFNRQNSNCFCKGRGHWVNPQGLAFACLCEAGQRQTSLKPMTRVEYEQQQQLFKEDQNLAPLTWVQSLREQLHNKLQGANPRS